MSAEILSLFTPQKTLPSQTSAENWSSAQTTLRAYDVKESAMSNTSDLTKDLLDARLEAVEARMDARVAGMSAKLDTTLAEMRADREASNHRFSRMESDLQAVSSGLSALSADVDRKLTAVAAQTADQVKGLKSNIWFGVATTIAAVGATLAIAISSFDSGRETSKSIAEATARMEKLQAQLEAQAKAAAAPPGASTKK